MVVKNSSTYTSPVLDEAFNRYGDLIFGNHNGGDGESGDDQFDMMISILCINLKSMDESVSTYWIDMIIHSIDPFHSIQLIICVFV